MDKFIDTKQQELSIIEQAREEAKSRAKRVMITIMGLVMGGSVAINVVNQLFVKNDYFVMMAIAVTGIMVIRYGNQRMQEERVSLIQKYEEILAKNNQET